jgi:hypothetical protein
MFLSLKKKKKKVIFVFKLKKFNQSALDIHRPSYSISAIKIEIVPFCRVIFKLLIKSDPRIIQSWTSKHINRQNQE